MKTEKKKAEEFYLSKSGWATMSDVEEFEDPEDVVEWLMDYAEVIRNEVEEKYYFITYQGHNNDGTKQQWNQVIDISPMEFIDKLQKAEKNADRSYYRNFVILNTCEISKGEFCAWSGQF